MTFYLKCSRPESPLKRRTALFMSEPLFEAYARSRFNRNGSLGSSERGGCGGCETRRNSRWKKRPLTNSSWKRKILELMTYTQLYTELMTETSNTSILSAEVKTNLPPDTGHQINQLKTTNHERSTLMHSGMNDQRRIRTENNEQWAHTTKCDVITS